MTFDAASTKTLSEGPSPVPETARTFELSKFSLENLIECGAAIRRVAAGSSSLEAAASQIARFLHESFVRDNAREIPLVRVYKTHAYGDLPSALQRFAAERVVRGEPSPEVRCLTLMGTAGENPDWNARATSESHQAIPLASVEMVARFPMIAQLLSQFGLDVPAVIAPDRSLLLELHEDSYGVFHIPEAAGSPYIPAQSNFVLPYGIRSVVGFGGVLPDGELFAVIMFARTTIDRPTADLFRWLALSTKVSLISNETQRVFDDNAEPRVSQAGELQRARSAAHAIAELLTVQERIVFRQAARLRSTAERLEASNEEMRRLQSHLKESADRASFLSTASQLLASSMDPTETLPRLAQLCVPTIADWCAIDLVEDGSVTRVAVMHREPAKVTVSPRTGMDTGDPAAAIGLEKVLRSGAPEVYADVPDEVLASLARDDEHRALMQGLGLRAVMIVPLALRDRTLGAMSFAISSSGRSFGAGDLALAEEVARRAAVALDNAHMLADIQAAEAQLRGFVRSLDAIVWEADPVMRRFVFVNERAGQILGYPPERWLEEEHFFPSHVHPLERDEVMAWFDQAASTPGDYDREYQVVRADGSQGWVRTLISSASDPRGAAVRLWGITIDVTQSRRTGMRLSAQAAATTALAEADSFADAARGVLRGLCETLGWDIGALWTLEPGADAVECAEVYVTPRVGAGEFVELTQRSVFRQGVGLPGRVWQSGEALWIEDVTTDPNFTRAPYAERSGIVTGIAFPVIADREMVGVMELFGVTRRARDDEMLSVMSAIGVQLGQALLRKAAEDALRESDARKTAIFEAALDCIITIDALGTILEWNPAAEQTFGFSRAEAIGREMAELIIPERLRDAHRAGMRRIAETGTATILGRRLELPAVRADGFEFVAEIAITRVESEDPPLFTGYLRDITEQKAAEEAIRVNEERARFLSRISAGLAASLDADACLRAVASLSVPFLADWCIIDVADGSGAMRRAAVAHQPDIPVDLARRIAEDSDLAPSAFVVDATDPGLGIELMCDARTAATTDPSIERLLNETGCVSILRAPLAGRGRALGAMLLLLSDSSREFTESDLTLAREVAHRTALALDRAGLYQERAYIADTLQRSLLPPRLPEIPGLELAARYRPAGHGMAAGGDFYDVFNLGGKSWAIVLGDACGKGPEAAALTALARYTVRAAALQARRPGRILGLLNEAIAQQADDNYCTAVFARIEPSAERFRVTLASGGHPLPRVVRSDGRIESIGRFGLVLGPFEDARLHEATAHLEPGDLIMFYTDGCTEARGPDGFIDEETLWALAAESRSLPAEDIAGRLERYVMEFQNWEPRDDIAIVIVKVPR